MGQIWDNSFGLLQSLDRFRANFSEDYRPQIVLTSGGFDPLHIGHVRCIKGSRYLGGRLIVVVNGDGFLLRKKGYVFMPLIERLEIISSLEGVDDVIAWDDGTQFVDQAILTFRPNVFAKGGDRSTPESIAIDEHYACNQVGCSIAYGVGGSDKVQSSSTLAPRK